MEKSSNDETGKLMENLNGEFEIKDLGLSKMVIGIDIIRNRERSEQFLFQFSYLKKMVEWFRMSNSKIVGTPLGHLTKLSVK